MNIDLGEKYKISLDESSNLMYIKRYCEDKKSFFVIGKINLHENVIRINTIDFDYNINSDINQEFLEMIISLYEDYIDSKRKLDESISKFKLLRDGDKSTLRDWKLNKIV